MVKHLVDQIRLLIAEWLLARVVDIVPPKHPDSVTIYIALNWWATQRLEKATKRQTLKQPENEHG